MEDNNIHIDKCFLEHIGVRGCVSDESKILWVNDLPGISNELLDKIADNEQDTYYKVFEKAVRIAANALRNDVMDIMLRERNRKRFGTVVYESMKMKIAKPIDVEPFEKLGLLLIAGESKYVVANIEGFTLAVMNESVEATIFIYDFEKGEKVLEITEPVTLKRGNNYVKLGFSFEVAKSKAMLLCIEAHGGIMQLHRVNCNGFRNLDCMEVTHGISNSYDHYYRERLKEMIELDSDFWGIYNVNYADEIVLEELEDIRHDFACLDLTVECSIDSFICEMAKRIAPALLYAVGANILTEKMGGYRTNYFAKGNMEFTADTRDDLRAGYKSHLKKIVRTLPLSGNSMCWECEDGTVSSSSLV